MEMSMSHTLCTANHWHPTTHCQHTKTAIWKWVCHIPPAQPTIGTHHPLSAHQNSNTEMSMSHTSCTANHWHPTPAVSTPKQQYRNEHVTYILHSQPLAPHHSLSAHQNSNTEMSMSHTSCTANHWHPTTCCQHTKIAIRK